MKYPDIRFRPRLQVIDAEQIDQIYAATLEVLERTGVKFPHPRAKQIFHDAGASVDGDLVRIPGSIMEDAIHEAPSRVVLGTRDAEPSVTLEGDRFWFGASLDLLDYLDPITDERRSFNLDDCRITATVADALPNIHWVMTIGLAADVPADTADRAIVKQTLTFTEKPLIFCCKDRNSLEDIYEMALVVCGGEEAFRRAPPVGLYLEPISPLVNYEPAIDKMIYCAEKGIPLVNSPAPTFGGTAPATFAGAVVQGLAESLSGLALCHLVRPGATPFICGAFTTVMDMSTTVFSYGAPEMSLTTAALAQVAQHLKIPFWGTAGCSDAKRPDPQAAAESAFSSLSSALIGANLIHDTGWIDHGALVSPGHMVLTNEILYMVKQYMGGVPVDEDALAVDLIDRVGPGGHFLTEAHTLEHFREVWYPRLFDRTTQHQWLQQGGKHFEERLRERTREAMDHEPKPLPPDIASELDRMARHWK